MTDMLTLTGLVATPPKHTTTANGLSITSFRLASNQRRYDRVKQEWVDAETNWYTVTSFRQLAKNVVLSRDARLALGMETILLHTCTICSHIANRTILVLLLLRSSP